MAFLGKIGNILRQSVCKQTSSELLASRPSIYNAIRCMSSSKLFIGGLSYGMDENSLRDQFSKYGEVLEARIIVDRESGNSRGFGFVTFGNNEEASSAIQALDGQDLGGRRVRVNYATERARPNYGGGGGFGGGGYGGGGGFGGGGYGGGGYSGGGGGYGGGAYGGGGYGGGSGDNYGSSATNHGNATDSLSGGSFGSPSNSGGFGGAPDFNAAGGAGGNDSFPGMFGGAKDSQSRAGDEDLSFGQNNNDQGAFGASDQLDDTDDFAKRA